MLFFHLMLLSVGRKANRYVFINRSDKLLLADSVEKVGLPKLPDH